MEEPPVVVGRGFFNSREQNCNSSAALQTPTGILKLNVTFISITSNCRVNLFHGPFSLSHQIDSSVCSDINHEAFRVVFSTFTMLLVDMNLPLNLKVLDVLSQPS